MMALELKRREVARVYEIAEKFNIRLMTEKELPVISRNLMKVEEHPDAFQEIYKKGTFFESGDYQKLNMESRLETIHKFLIDMDKYHKWQLAFFRQYGKKAGVMAELKEIINPSFHENLSFDCKGNLHTKGALTALHGIRDMTFKSTDDIWNNKNIMHYIESNTVGFKRKLKLD